MKRELLERIELLGDRLPANPLDQLIDDLGGVDCVAEVILRKLLGCCCFVFFLGGGLFFFLCM